MECPNDSVLEAYARGALAGVSPSQLTEHVRSCTACASRLVALKPAHGARNPRDLPTVVLEEKDRVAWRLRPPPMFESQTQLQTPSGEQREPQVAAGTALGRYVVLMPIGEGGMGVVYRAYDPQLNRMVAIKLLRGPSATSEGRARMMREAQAMARLSHPNVVAVHDVGAVGDQVFVAMDLVEGGTLDQWLREASRSWREVVSVFLQAGKGLAAAHRAGLVHRDFKPGNILLDKEGIVRVMDFGLARLVDPSSPDEPPTLGDGLDSSMTLSRTSALEEPVTAAGKLLGTPGYMAPEQFRDKATDARTDQFSFCVALFEALYGGRPFQAETVDTLMHEVLAGNVRLPPASTKVPAWLHRAVLRGLSVDPAQRYPSMDELLAALAQDPAVGRRRALRAGVTAAVVLAALVGYRAVDVRRSQVCQGAERELAGAWDAQKKEAIRASFLASGKPFAPDAWQAVERALDAYASGWVRMHTEACEATRLRGSQSEEMLGARMVCLDRRKRELSALADLFEHADSKLVERSVSAAHALPALSGCADLSALAAKVPPPPEGSAPKVETIRGQLAEASALSLAGRFAKALEVGTAALGRASELGYRPLAAEARYTLAKAQGDAGNHAEAVKNLYEALWDAQATGQDELAITVLLRLAREQGLRLAQVDASQLTVRQARALLDRLGSNPEIEGNVEYTIGTLEWSQSHYEEAVAHYRRAWDLGLRAYGAESTVVSNVMGNLASALWDAGHRAEAISITEQTLALREKIFGKEHPDVALALNTLASGLNAQGRYREALEVYRRSLRILEGSYGPEHQFVAVIHNNLGEVLLALGRLDEATAEFKRAIAIYEKGSGRDFPAMGYALVNLGSVYRHQRRYAEALAQINRSLAIREKGLGADAPEVADCLASRASVFLDMGKPGDAIRDLDRALAIREKAVHGDHPDLAADLVELGEAHLAARAPARALPVLERALGMMARDEKVFSPEQLGEARFALARALWDGGKDRSRARGLVVQARANLASTQHEDGKRTLGRIDAWLAARGN